MAPIDGAIGMKININTAQTTDVNISKAQPSKASGLGGVRPPSSKRATTLYKYKLTAPGQRTRMLRFPAIWTFFQKIIQFPSIQFSLWTSKLENIYRISGDCCIHPRHGMCILTQSIKWAFTWYHFHQNRLSGLGVIAGKRHFGVCELYILVIFVVDRIARGVK